MSIETTLNLWFAGLAAALAVAIALVFWALAKLQTQINEDEETQDDFTAAIGRAHIRKDME